MAGCEVMTGDDLAASMCNIDSVQGGLPAQIPPAYKVPPPRPGAAQMRAGVQKRPVRARASPQKKVVKRNASRPKVNTGVKMRMSPPSRRR